MFDSVAINYFRKIVEENIEKRRKEKIIRPDIMYLLLEAQANKTNSQGNNKIQVLKLLLY